MSIRYFVVQKEQDDNDGYSEKPLGVFHVEVDGKINSLCGLFPKVFLKEKPCGRLICARCVKRFDLKEYAVPVSKKKTIDVNTLSLTYIMVNGSQCYHIEIKDQETSRCANNARDCAGPIMLYPTGKIGGQGVITTEKPTDRTLCQRCKVFYSRLGIEL